MEQIRVARSFIAADALAEVIASEYDLQKPVACKLFSKMLRTQDNDHYLVVTGDDEKYVVRVYQRGDHLQRKKSDYLFEIDWLNFLKKKELPISYPLQRRDGNYLGSINAPEGLRYYALFTFAEGETMSLKDEEQLFICGANIAKIHLASNEFFTSHERRPLDLEYLVDDPIERIKRNWGVRRAANLDILIDSADEAKAEVISLLGDAPDADDSWGVIGGDFHNASTYFTADKRPTFFNFDLCGYGWRAYDIAVFLSNTDLVHTSTTLSEAFFAGYYSVRQLSKAEHEAISPFLTIRRIWLMGTFAMDDGLAGHTFLGTA